MLEFLFKYHQSFLSMCINSIKTLERFQGSVSLQKTGEQILVFEGGKEGLS